MINTLLQGQIYPNNNMKKTAILLCLSALLSCTGGAKKEEDKSPMHHQQMGTNVNGEKYARDVNSGAIKTDTLKGSPERMEMASIDGIHIHIVYSSPGVKGRVIWGGLVPFDQLWVTGAHHATKISFNKDVLINGQKLKAGEYAFFTIPGKKHWTLIFNKRVNQHLADDYQTKEDALRLEVIPVQLPGTVQRLTYRIRKDEGKGGTVSMQWEKINISFKILSNKNH